MAQPTEGTQSFAKSTTSPLAAARSPKRHGNSSAPTNEELEYPKAYSKAVANHLHRPHQTKYGTLGERWKAAAEPKAKGAGLAVRVPVPQGTNCIYY